MSTPILINILSISIVTLVSLVEAPLLLSSQQGAYLGFRTVIIIGFALLIHFRRYFQQVWYGICWCSLFYAYSIIGEIYRPLYIMAIVQIQLLHVLYFKHSKNSFLLTHTSGTTIFALVMINHWDQNLVRLSHSNVADQLSIGICSLVTSTLVYIYIKNKNEQAELMTKKLALVGNFSSSLIHDLKNLNSSPLLYSEILVHKKDILNKDQLSRISETLNYDLKRIQLLVRDLYDTAQISEISKEAVDINKLIAQNVDVLKNRLGGIFLNIEGTLTVNTDRRIINVILMNLFYNAISALSESQRADKKIEIFLTKNKIQFQSNTFNENGDVNTTGLGTHLMSELARHSNIHIAQSTQYSNWITTISF